MGAIRCALLDNSQVPHPAKRFFSVMNVPSISVLVTKMWFLVKEESPFQA